MTIRDIIDAAGRIITTAGPDSDRKQLAWALGATVLSAQEMAALLAGELCLVAGSGNPGRGHIGVSWDGDGAQVIANRAGRIVEVVSVRWAEVAAVLRRAPADLLAAVTDRPMAVWAACRPQAEPADLLDLLAAGGDS